MREFDERLAAKSFISEKIAVSYWPAMNE